jgi:hypothetical protein
MRISLLTSRLAAIAVAIIALLAVWDILYRPVLDQMTEDQKKSSMLMLAKQRDATLGAAIPVMRVELQKLAATRALDGVFLNGTNSTVLAAELQRTAAGLIASAGANLISSRTAPAEQEQGHVRIGLDLDITASAAATQSMLYLFETTMPLLSVDRLNITVPEDGVPTISADPQPILNVHVRLTAYARSSA